MKRFKARILNWNRLILPSFLILLSLFLLAADKESDEKKLLDNLDLFSDVVTMIDGEYYRDVEAKDLMMGAVEGLMASLDRYSYVKKRGGEVGSAGIGLELSIVDNILTVVTAIEGSPAAKADIMHGDKVVKINGERISNVTLDNVSQMIWGEPGTEVSITIYREGEKETRDLVIEREKDVLPGLQECIIYDGAVGYVRLASIPPGSGQEFIGEVKRLLGEAMKGLVIDLRDNPGGDINDATAIAGYLIGDGRSIVSIDSRLEKEKMEFKAPASQPPDISIAVLVNSGTAGEAEVLAGALKDSGKAILIGSKTFGYNSIQKDIPLDETLALHLTVARYVFPGETKFDKEGIEPDIEVQIAPEKEALLQKIREGIDVDKKERPADSQLERAVDLLKGIGILGKEATS